MAKIHSHSIKNIKRKSKSGSAKTNLRTIRDIKRKSNLNTAKVLEIFRTVRIKNTTHVKFAPSNGSWVVVIGKQTRATRTFENKDVAIKYATGLARRRKTELSIHTKNGKIISSSRYGNIDLEVKNE